MSAEDIQELDAKTDAFYKGLDAYEKGLLEVDCPADLSDALQHSWLGGHRSAKRNAEHPGLPAAEYFRIRDLADEAYKTSKISGLPPKNPYSADTEANDIWATRMQDCPLYYGDVEDEFVVLGKPTPVTVISEHSDGSITCSIPARIATT